MNVSQPVTMELSEREKNPSAVLRDEREEGKNHAAHAGQHVL